MQSESAKLMASIEATRASYAPMRHLIPEICHIIFAFCADEPCNLDCVPLDNDPFETCFPILLSHVCRRWRTMVLRNPALWTNIHVRPMTMDTFRARLWLDRSANMPLQVTICPSQLRKMSWDMRSICTTIIPIIHQFVPHLLRIKSFKTNLGTQVLPILFPQGKMVQMPVLQDLSLFIDDPSVETSSLGQLNAPNCSSLHVRDTTPLANVLDPVFPSLHALTIDHCSSWKFPSTFPETLAKCTQLRSCTITFPSDLFFVALEPIVLPGLVELSLEWPFLFEPSSIFCALRAPNLQSLRLSHLSPNLILPQHTISALKGLIQSATGLKHLIIMGCNLLTQEEAFLFLREAKFLERLEILYCKRGDRFLAPLTPPNPLDTRKWICPKLTHVTISGIQNTDVRPIVNFARSRSDRQVKIPEGAKFLKELALDSNLFDLTRQLRLLMLSGLLSLHPHLHIMGPFGELLGPTQQ